jgi:hypothetical protein
MAEPDARSPSLDGLTACNDHAIVSAAVDNDPPDPTEALTVAGLCGAAAHPVPEP